MDINLPFRLKDIYNYRNLKTENNRINLEKKKKKIYRNIKSIWNKESNLVFDIKNSPSKDKPIQPLSIINVYNKNQNIKSLSIDNSEKNIHDKKDNKKLLFEDDFYMDKLKRNQINFTVKKSSNRNKGDCRISIKNISNYFYLINKYRNKKNETEKTHIVNLPIVKANNMPPESFLDEKNFFINLNNCLHNFANRFNKDAVTEFIKKQNKIYHINNNNYISEKKKKKFKKNENNISYNENIQSLNNMIHIEPIKTNINGKIHEFNISYGKNSSIENKKVNNSFTKENIGDKKKNIHIILPNLKKEQSIINEKNSIIYRKTFNSSHNKINKTENNISGFIQYKNNNLKNVSSKNNNINLLSISSNLNLTKSQSQFSSPKNNKDKIQKYKFNHKLNKLLYEIPPPNFYSKDFYYYNIFPHNCGWLIKKCLSHRTKWRECHSNNTNLFDFKWKDVITTKDFIEFGGPSKKQIINHFENHSCISNKYKMFYNFAKFCENNSIDVFKYVPFTLGFDYLNYDELNIYQDNFKELFNHINNYIFDNDSINNQLYDRKKIPYKQLFPLNDPKMGIKFYCEIPRSHFAGKNLWIVKAPNLNRGRCIKIFDNYNDIIKFLNEMKKGMVHQYDNIKEKGCKNEKINEEKEENEIKNEIKNEKNDKSIEKENIKKENEDIKESKILISEKETKKISNKDNCDKSKNKEKKEKEKGDYQSDKIIIQKYIEKPFLYNGRKFDIRIWVLISHKMDVYIFKEGHLKASSVNYNIDNNNSFIHLTNYSLQKYNKNFSKYETGNEISFNTFQQYLNSLGDKTFNFKELAIPKFKKIIELTTKCAKNIINPKNKNYCFEIFGYDFMMDENKNMYLIEINTNPGLEISSEIIEILVPRMIEDALRITVDDLFETDYSEEWVSEDGKYKSNYHVEGYDDKDNMWEYICNINKSNDKYICEDYYGFGYIKNSNKRKKKSKKKE